MVKVQVTHTIATLVKINEFYEVDETVVDIRGRKTKEQIERMFKGSKVKELETLTDVCRLPMEELLKYRETVTHGDLQDMLEQDNEF